MPCHGYHLAWGWDKGDEFAYPQELPGSPLPASGLAFPPAIVHITTVVKAGFIFDCLFPGESCLSPG
jgi:hypothetical protein